MDDIRTTIMGRRWRLVFSPHLMDRYGNMGECDSARSKRKSIYVDIALADWQMLDTIVHEMLHAAYPDLSEHSVDQFGRDVTRILKRVFTIQRLGDKHGEASEQPTGDGTGNTPATQ